MFLDDIQREGGVLRGVLLRIAMHLHQVHGLPAQEGDGRVW